MHVAVLRLPMVGVLGVCGIGSERVAVARFNKAEIQTVSLIEGRSASSGEGFKRLSAEY